MAEELHYRLLKILERESAVSQRTLASRLDISVGKVNSCLREMLSDGWIEVRTSRNADNKQVYAYEITALGREQRSALTVTFLRRKQRQYEQLEREIERLKSEIQPRG